MEKIIFTEAFQDRMKFLENFRKEHHVRDYSKNPYPFTEEELREQEAEHKRMLNELGKLKKHTVMTRPKKEECEEFEYYSKDTAFAAHARLLQSKWRKKKGYGIGKSVRGTVLGNYIDYNQAKREKVNFLTENIRTLVDRELEEAKESNALISPRRLLTNMLSSQPLCFNLFGEMSYNKELATVVFQHLFPNRLDKVEEVKFEYHPDRKNLEKYTGDRSAFDVFVEYSKGNKKGFIGIEVKYAESLREEAKSKAFETFERHKERYTHWSKQGHFKSGESIDVLKCPPLSQIWRDHLLCIATKQDYNEGIFVFLFPKENKECQNGVDEYKKQLSSANEDTNCFYPRYLDDFIDALAAISNEEWVKELKERYIGK